MLLLSAGLLIPDVDGFSGNLFAVLIHYFEVGEVARGKVLGFTMDVNFPG